MRSLFLEIYSALNNVYSGWILWNLFLAFIPLCLSFVLFRRQMLSTGWLIAICFFGGVIGVLGTKFRTPWVLQLFLNRVDQAIAHDFATQLNLIWFVALILFTLGVSIWLFKKDATLRSGLWGLGFLIFMAFLPNAPYVLTDIIHLIRGIRFGDIPTWIIALVFIPLHVTAIICAFEAYVISLLNFGHYLRKNESNHWILPMELITHVLCAIGIYLGRFIRLNSWDFVAHPTSVFMTTVNTLTSKRPFAVICVTFVILTVFYWIMKQITLGLKLRFRDVRQCMDISR